MATEEVNDERVTPGTTIYEMLSPVIGGVV